jgi:hypothetical protein
VGSYIKQHPDFAEIGQAMLEQWEIGANLPLHLT